MDYAYALEEGQIIKQQDIPVVVMVEDEQSGAFVEETVVIDEENPEHATTITTDSSSSLEPRNSWDLRQCPVVAAHPVVLEASVEARSIDNTTRPEYLSVSFGREYQANFCMAMQDNDNNNENDDDSSGGVLCISYVAPSSPLSKSNIRKGDEIVRINGIDCRGQSVQFAQRTLRKQTYGGLSTVIVRTKRGIPELISSQTIKKNARYSTGLDLIESRERRTRHDGDDQDQHHQTVLVGSVDPKGLFGHSLLRVGDRVVSINDVCCCNGTTTVEQAKRIIQDADGSITIVTCRTNPRTRPSYCSATVYIKDQNNPTTTTTTKDTVEPKKKKKRRNSAKIPSQGIGLGVNLFDRDIHVTSIAPFGKFCFSPIRVGDKVMSVNGVDLEFLALRDRKTRKEPNASLEQIVKTSPDRDKLTVVVKVEDGNPRHVATMITKPTVDSNIGLGLVQRSSGVIITAVEETGLAASSLLNVGDRVVSINGHDCTILGTPGAVQLVRTSYPTVTIISETKTGKGVVVASWDGRIFRNSNCTRGALLRAVGVVAGLTSAAIILGMLGNL